jgi:micrococcal nuclease
VRRIIVALWLVVLTACQVGGRSRSTAPTAPPAAAASLAAANSTTAAPASINSTTADSASINSIGISSVAADPAVSESTEAGVVANAIMVRDVDGDTIDVTISGHAERVRLIGIDTPETKKPDTPIQCYGEEASAYTSSLLAKGTPLRLERDVVARDDYGRLLAYVYRAGDGLFVNLDVIAKGYARVLTIKPNTAHMPDFVAAATAAEINGLGLWSSCKQP